VSLLEDMREFDSMSDIELDSEIDISGLSASSILLEPDKKVLLELSKIR
jgi:hypothetical protein